MPPAAGGRRADARRGRGPLGGNGAVCFWNGQKLAIDGLPASCVDTCGAGDAFWGAFLAGLLQAGVRKSEDLSAAIIRAAMQRGNIAGWLCVQKKGAIESLGTPDQAIIGYDPDQQAIGVRARGEDTTSPCYDFAPRVKNDWIRIGAKDFMKHLSRTSKIDFLTKAKQFIAEYDEETQTLIVVIDEAHLK